MGPGLSPNPNQARAVELHWEMHDLESGVLTREFALAASRTAQPAWSYIGAAAVLRIPAAELPGQLGGATFTVIEVEPKV